MLQGGVFLKTVLRARFVQGGAACVEDAVDVAHVFVQGRAANFQTDRPKQAERCQRSIVQVGTSHPLAALRRPGKSIILYYIILHYIILYYIIPYYIKLYVIILVLYVIILYYIILYYIISYILLQAAPATDPGCRRRAHATAHVR